MYLTIQLYLYPTLPVYSTSRTMYACCIVALNIQLLHHGGDSSRYQEMKVRLTCFSFRFLRWFPSRSQKKRMSKDLGEPAAKKQRTTATLDVGSLNIDLLSAEARPKLLNLFRALSLRHDELGQEIVLNELLRNLLHHHLYDHAERIISTCVLQQPYRSNNQAARFYYYDALTRAIRLDYSEAANSVQQALRKAPERALGFRIAATKLQLVISLLLGEIPCRSDFLQQGMKDALAPYLQLTSCVRFGNLGRFQQITQQHAEQFEFDRTYTLILRVRQNVIKTGLRRICQAYSTIGFADLCVKLALDNPEDAEYIVAKSIRDGVIDATIDHEKGHLVSSETVDVYSTNEPLAAFQRRVTFLNATHIEAKRAMRYAPLNDPEEDEKRRKKEMEELARALEDDDGGDIDFSDGI
jgi:26S proteasome regulatory subunit N3